MHYPLKEGLTGLLTWTESILPGGSTKAETLVPAQAKRGVYHELQHCNLF